MHLREQALNVYIIIGYESTKNTNFQNNFGPNVRLMVLTAMLFIENFYSQLSGRLPVFYKTSSGVCATQKPFWKSLVKRDNFSSGGCYNRCRNEPLPIVDRARSLDGKDKMILLLTLWVLGGPHLSLEDIIMCFQRFLYSRFMNIVMSPPQANLFSLSAIISWNTKTPVVSCQLADASCQLH